MGSLVSMRVTRCPCVVQHCKNGGFFADSGGYALPMTSPQQVGGTWCPTAPMVSDSKEAMLLTQGAQARPVPSHIDGHCEG